MINYYILHYNGEDNYFHKIHTDINLYTALLNPRRHILKTSDLVNAVIIMCLGYYLLKYYVIYHIKHVIVIRIIK